MDSAKFCIKCHSCDIVDEVGPNDICQFLAECLQLISSYVDQLAFQLDWSVDIDVTSQCIGR